MSVRLEIGALIALASLAACGGGEEATDATPSPSPKIDLTSVRFPEGGLPDPCELLEAAGGKILLDRPVDEPRRLNRRCFLRTRRDAGRPRGGVELELVTRDQPQPGDLDEYWEERGTAASLLGVQREELVELPGLGDYSVWFPYGEDGMQLASYWAGKYSCLVTVRGVSRERALHWARELTEELTRRVR